MAKLFNAITGEEIIFGKKTVFQHSGDNYYWNLEITVTDDNINELVEGGLVVEKEITLSDVVERLIVKVGDVETVDSMLATLEQGYPGALLNVYLREIALMLDEKYEDHISKSDEIFVISITDGSIKRCPKSVITTYNTFAAFRTLEDAKYACRILKPVFKGIYGKSKNKECK